MSQVPELLERLEDLHNARTLKMPDSIIRTCQYRADWVAQDIHNRATVVAMRLLRADGTVNGRLEASHGTAD